MTSDKSTKWLQNMCNPRLKVSVNGPRVVADIQRSLLLRAGDVETNPGPTFTTWVFVALACFFCSGHAPADVSDIGYGIGDACSQFRHAVVTAVLPWLRRTGEVLHVWADFIIGNHLDNIALQCSHELAWIELVNWLATFPIVGLFLTLRRATLECTLVHALWSKPVVSVLPAWAFPVVIICFTVCTCTVFGVVWWFVWWCTRGV